MIGRFYQDKRLGGPGLRDVREALSLCKCDQPSGNGGLSKLQQATREPLIYVFNDFGNRVPSSAYVQEYSHRRLPVNFSDAATLH